jgi:hypothetical protein
MQQIQQHQQTIIQFVRSISKNLPQILPQVLDITKIDKIMDRRFLEMLEYQYDKFLEANLQILDLYNVIDYLLDVRDAILLKLNRMIREEKIRQHNEDNYRQTKKQNQQDESQSIKILIEYNCGCQNLIYSNQNSGMTKNFAKQENTNLNGSSRHHCLTHLKLLKTQSMLEIELIKVRDELQDATNRQNIRSVNYCK